MSYIIVWRNRYREPFIEVDSHNFKEDYSSYEDAKAAAERIHDQENSGVDRSPWYFDYQIYEEVNE